MYRCDTADECGIAECPCGLPHKPFWPCNERRNFCSKVDGHVLCTPTDKELCDYCGAHKSNWRDMLGTECKEEHGEPRSGADRAMFLSGIEYDVNLLKRKLGHFPTEDEMREAIERKEEYGKWGEADLTKDWFVGIVPETHTCYFCDHSGSDVNRIAVAMPPREYCCDDAVECDTRWQKGKKEDKIRAIILDVAVNYIGNTVHQRNVRYIAEDSTARIMELP